MPQEIRFDIEVPEGVAVALPWAYAAKATRSLDGVRWSTRVQVSEDGHVALWDGQVYGPADALSPEIRSYALNRAADVLAGRVRVVARTVLQLEPVPA